jgi:hypothetical protein
VLTGAMDYLGGSRGVLALPIHDSLLVPRSAVGHVGGGFDGSFGYFAKVRPHRTLEQAPDMPRAWLCEAQQRPVALTGRGQ